MAKKRINLTIEPKLHDWAQSHAERNGTTFSAYVSDLLRRERDGSAVEIKLTDAQRAELRAEVAEDLLSTLMLRRREKR